MELAVIDTFVRPDTSRGGSRAGENSGVSFSDVLDASTRPPESTPRSRDADNRKPSTAETPAARADEAPKSDDAPKSKADAPKTETTASAPAKPKADAPASEDSEGDAPAETAAETPADSANDNPAPAQLAEAPADGNGKGAAALDLIAELVAAGSATTDTALPKGQMVAAIVVPQNVPEHAAAAGQHAIPATGTTPAPVAPPVPTGTEPAIPPAAAPTGFAPTPASNQTSSAAAANAAAPAAQPAIDMPAAAPSNAPAVAPMSTAAPAAAATAPTAATGSVTATLPADLLVSELVDETGAPLFDPLNDNSPLPATSAGASSSATAASGRAASSQGTVSGYVAQMVSQDAANAEAPPVPTAPIDGETPVPAATSQNTDATLLGAAADGDEAIAVATKPAEGATFAAADAGTTQETHSVETAAARAARMPAVPVPDQVVVRIAKALADGVDRINVKLSPAELGHIDVRMEIGPDGRFQAVFAADRPQTVELLQRDARELARALQDAGLRADTGSLSFNLRGQGQQGNSDSAPTHRGPLGLTAGADLPGETALPPVYRAPGLAAGRVDIRV